MSATGALWCKREPEEAGGTNLQAACPSRSAVASPGIGSCIHTHPMRTRGLKNLKIIVKGPGDKEGGKNARVTSARSVGRRIASPFTHSSSSARPAAAPSNGTPICERDAEPINLPFATAASPGSDFTAVEAAKSPDPDPRIQSPAPFPASAAPPRVVPPLPTAVGRAMLYRIGKLFTCRQKNNSPARSISGPCDRADWIYCREDNIFENLCDRCAKASCL